MAEAATVSLTQAQLQDLLTQAAQKGAQAATAAAAAAAAPPPPPKPTASSVAASINNVEAQHNAGTGIHITVQGIFNILRDLLTVVSDVIPGNKVVQEIGTVASTVAPIVEGIAGDLGL